MHNFCHVHQQRYEKTPEDFIFLGIQHNIIIDTRQASPGALAHHLQCLTTHLIQNA